MPARSKGPRLYLRPARHDKTGHHAARGIIRDGNHQQSTRSPTYDVTGAERALGLYITNKHVRAARASKRDPGQIPIAGILAIYLRDVVSRHSRPKETKSRIKALDSFFGDKLLSYVTGETCRAYVAQRSTDAAARRELEDLRAAINHHRREGLCDKIVPIVLPEKAAGRDVSLTRSQAAR